MSLKYEELLRLIEVGDLSHRFLGKSMHLENKILLSDRLSSQCLILILITRTAEL
jgi:hypothetical protein